MSHVQALIGGFLLDQLLGDPPRWPHPVRWIGRLSDVLETPLRKLRWERLAGVILVVTVVASTGLFIWAVLELASWIRGVWLVLAILLVYLGLAVRSLADHTFAVVVPLEKGDLAEARRRLARIVGRDTGQLSKEDIERACIETVAENTTDGVIAPLFYTAIGGPIGLWIYKAINTLDSMIGHRNPRYRYFGWAAARLDDLANFIPARLTLALMPLGAMLTRHAGWRALTTGWRDGRKHPSPNAGLAEAAMAGALGVQLGGPSTYAGLVSDKPLLGEPREPLTTKKVRQAIKVMKMTAWLMLAVACGIAVAVQLAWGTYRLEW